MHQKGQRFVNRQFRGADSVLVRESYVDFYDFDQSGKHAVQQQPFRIQKGDSFQTLCYFEADGEDIFGYGSAEEMCIAYLSYYPRKEVGTPGQLWRAPMYQHLRAEPTTPA